jgi:predicted transcriptional regulator
MPLDDQSIEDAVLALLGVFANRDGQTWKRYEFTVMESLFEKGLITDPHGKRESVFLTEEGALKANELAVKLFSN